MKTAIALTVERWTAWAPGLDTADAWTQWLAHPTPLRGDEPNAPPLVEVPAMARRRIEPLGRAALQVAYQCQDDLAPDEVAGMPLLFASRWGELARSMAMLQELARGEPLSPTAFSHSVHNAIGAQYSIQRGITAPATALAAADASFEAAWLEALGLLATEHPRVLVVAFDAALPPAYADTGLDAPLMRPHAVALRLRRSATGEAGVVLRTGGSVAPEGEGRDPLPGTLQALRWLLGDAPNWAHADGGLVWQWSRGHGG